MCAMLNELGLSRNAAPTFIIDKMDTAEATQTHILFIAHLSIIAETFLEDLFLSLFEIFLLTTQSISMHDQQTSYRHTCCLGCDSSERIVSEI